MKVRLLVLNRSQCRKNAVFEVLNITSLIIPNLITIQVCSARCCHERSIFHVPWEMPLVRVLSHTVLSTSWWPSDWSRSHFNSWYYYVIHCCQNRVMDRISGRCSSTVNLSLNCVGNFSFNYLIMIWTVLNDCWSPKSFKNNPQSEAQRFRLHLHPHWY